MCAKKQSRRPKSDLTHTLTPLALAAAIREVLTAMSKRTPFKWQVMTGCNSGTAKLTLAATKHLRVYVEAEAMAAGWDTRLGSKASVERTTHGRLLGWFEVVIPPEVLTMHSSGAAKLASEVKLFKTIQRMIVRQFRAYVITYEDWSDRKYLCDTMDDTRTCWHKSGASWEA